MVVGKKLHLAHALRQDQALERLALCRLDSGTDSGLALRTLEGAQVPDQAAHIGIIERKRRHADLWFSPADDLRQFFVIQRQQAGGNRRPVFSSLRIASVARDAVLKLVRSRRLVLGGGYRNPRQQTGQAQGSLNERHGTEHIT